MAGGLDSQTTGFHPVQNRYCILAKIKQASKSLFPPDVSSV
jgi:hypothetical protein